MAPLAKPNWYGAPVLVKANVVRYLRSFTVLVGVSCLLGLAMVWLQYPTERSDLGRFLFGFLVFSAFVVFLAGWFIGVFFWFRLAVNLLKMSRHRSEDRAHSLFDRFVNPLHGWRNEDLADSGRRYRRLALEGFVGFAGTVLVMLGFILASQMVGFEW